MENPYAAHSQSEMPGSKTWHYANVLIALVSIAFMVANYATATNVPRERWDIFPHVVFLMAPVSFLIHLETLVGRPRETATSRAGWLLLALLLIPASFLLSISPYFSANPYEGFVVMNRFFGPYGWMFWTWLVVLGILPFLELIPAIRRSRSTMILLSLTAIVAQVHNAYWIWRICHMQA